MKRLKENNLKVNLDKSILEAQTEIEALGFRLSHDQITPTNAYIESIIEFKVEADKKSLRKFLGNFPMSYGYSGITTPRNALFACLNMHKDRVVIDPRARSAIDEIKSQLRKPMPLQGTRELERDQYI